MQDLGSIALLALAVGLLLLERLSPWRRSLAPVQNRWLTNIGLFLLGGIIASLVFPATVVSVAREMPAGGLRKLQLPLVAEVLLMGLILDFWRYWEHRVFHEISPLWRLHLVHHSDTSLDLTTSQRHHPLETILAFCTALLTVFALGLSAQALVAYLTLGGLWSLLTHANIRLPEGIDRPLRRVLVTPAIHAVHHSDLKSETDSNYGSLLTIWDRLFGTYVDPRHACIPNFGLEYFHQPDDTNLGPVLLQPFEYRREMNYPSRAALPSQDEVTRVPALSQPWRRSLRLLGIAIGIALLALWPTAVSLVRTWTADGVYQYAWLVIPLLIYLLGWYYRDRVLALTPRPDRMGLLLVGPALLLWCAASVVDIVLLQQVALVLLLQGLALCALGRATYRALFPVMALLFLLIPSGDILQPTLRSLTVKWIEWYAIALQLPYSAEGFVVHVAGHRYVVIDACSGLAFVLMGGFLGYSFGLLIFRSLSRILALAALGALLGVATNAARIWLILSVDLWQGTQMDVAAHENLQWVALLGALGFLFYITLKLSATSPDPAVHADDEGATGSWRGHFAPVFASVLVLATAGVTQLALNRGSDVQDSLQQIAGHYPHSHWLHENQPGLRSLSIPFDRVTDVVILEPRSGQGRLNAQLLGPQNRSVWRHAATANYADCHAGHCIDFVHKTWRRKGEYKPRHTFYVYYAGELITDSRLAYRLTRGWNRLTGSGREHGLIGVELRGAIPGASQLAQLVHQFRNNGGREGTVALNTSTH